MYLFFYILFRIKSNIHICLLRGGEKVCVRLKNEKNEQQQQTKCDRKHRRLE